MAGIAGTSVRRAGSTSTTRPPPPNQSPCAGACGPPRPAVAPPPRPRGPDAPRLSKRHGATSVLAFRDEGFLPEAMVNSLARLGWAHGDQEVFTREELTQMFDLRQVGQTPAIFDRAKLEWLNQVWLKRLAEDPGERERLATAGLRPFVERLGVPPPAGPPPPSAGARPAAPAPPPPPMAAP